MFSKYTDGDVALLILIPHQFSPGIQQSSPPTPVSYAGDFSGSRFTPGEDKQEWLSIKATESSSVANENTLTNNVKKYVPAETSRELQLTWKTHFCIQHIF